MKCASYGNDPDRNYGDSIAAASAGLYSGWLIASLTNANGFTTSFTPDGFDRLSTTTYPNSSTQVLTYDADSNVLSRQTRAGATISFTYDTLNRLSTKAAPSESTVTYSYDLGITELR
jgi:YD repeat-containing protein